MQRNSSQHLFMYAYLMGNITSINGLWDFQEDLLQYFADLKSSPRTQFVCSFAFGPSDVKSRRGDHQWNFSARLDSGLSDFRPLPL